MFSILFLSQGIPMLLAGDEVMRGQQGNNNAWCQDNEIGWFDWSLVEQNADLLRFVRGLIALRKRHPNLQYRHFLTGRSRNGSEAADICWHGTVLGKPRWLDKECRHLAFTLAPREAAESFIHVLLNMEDAALEFELPPLPRATWHLTLDTARESPGDLVEPVAQVPLDLAVYRVSARSVVVLEGLPFERPV